MQTDSHFRSSDISLSSHQIANTLYRCLERAIELQAPQQQSTSVSPRRLPRTAASQLMRFQLTGRNCTRMVVAVTVTRHPPNIYDIVCDVEDGSSHRFSCSLPAGVPPTLLRASQLGQKIARFIQEELPEFRDVHFSAERLSASKN